MKIQACPVCHSKRIKLYAGGQTGQYECEDCGYVGSLIIEQDIERRV
jgi:transcription initiation factor TFIIIB Brf1 subunit/transcription initiation factor TFIIB